MSIREYNMDVENIKGVFGNVRNITYYDKDENEIEGIVYMEFDRGGVGLGDGFDKDFLVKDGQFFGMGMKDMSDLTEEELEEGQMEIRELFVVD